MEWIKQIVQALVIVLLQVLLFDHLQIVGWGFPMVYVMILMNLPVQIPRWLEMLIGAVVGLVFDVWCSSLGVNMAACIAFSFLRPRQIPSSDVSIPEILSTSHILSDLYFYCKPRLSHVPHLEAHYPVVSDAKN